MKNDIKSKVHAVPATVMLSVCGTHWKIYVFVFVFFKGLSAHPAILGLNDIPLEGLLSVFCFLDECVSTVDVVNVVIWLGPVRIMVCLELL